MIQVLVFCQKSCFTSWEQAQDILSTFCLQWKDTALSSGELPTRKGRAIYPSICKTCSKQAYQGRTSVAYTFQRKVLETVSAPVNYELFPLCFYEQRRNSLIGSLKIFPPPELWSHFIFGHFLFHRYFVFSQQSGPFTHGDISCQIRLEMPPRFCFY